MKASRMVFLLAAILFLWNLWGYDLWAPDEPYFGEGAREMVVDGQWILPHVNGVVTPDKPPLFFWLIAMFSLPLGQVFSVTARLPSALAALGTVALTMRLGRRLFDYDTGVLAGLVLATTYLFWDKARSAQIDSLLCFLILVALSAFEAFRSGEVDGRRAGILFWIASSFAVLAKGPVGLLLPLGIVLVFLATEREMGAWRRFAPGWGPLAFLAIVGLWAALATVAGGEEYSVWAALREHAIGRAFHGMHHAKPPWYYLKAMPVLLIPWTGLVPGALLLAWRRRRPADRFLLVFAAFVVAFFSISTEKRGLYVLPAVPALALLVARLVTSVREGERGASVAAPGPAIGRRWVILPQGLLGALFVLVGSVLPVVAGRFPAVPSGVAFALGGILLTLGIVTGWAAMKGRLMAAVLLPAAALPVAYLVLVTALFPPLDRIKSARPFALKIREITESARGAGVPVLAFRIGNLPDAFSFYSNGVYLRETSDPVDLARHLEREGTAFAVADGDQLDLLPRHVRDRTAVVASTVLSRIRVVLISNRPPPAAAPDSSPVEARRRKFPVDTSL